MAQGGLSVECGRLIPLFKVSLVVFANNYLMLQSIAQFLVDLCSYFVAQSAAHRPRDTAVVTLALKVYPFPFMIFASKLAALFEVRLTALLPSVDEEGVGPRGQQGLSSKKVPRPVHNLKIVDHHHNFHHRIHCFFSATMHHVYNSKCNTSSMFRTEAARVRAGGECQRP